MIHLPRRFGRAGRHTMAWILRIRRSTDAGTNDRFFEHERCRRSADRLAAGPRDGFQLTLGRGTTPPGGGLTSRTWGTRPRRPQGGPAARLPETIVSRWSPVTCRCAPTACRRPSEGALGWHLARGLPPAMRRRRLALTAQTSYRRRRPNQSGIGTVGKCDRWHPRVSCRRRRPRRRPCGSDDPGPRRLIRRC